MEGRGGSRPKWKATLAEQISLIRVRTLYSRQPLNEAFQILIADVGSPRFHLHRDHPPLVRAVSGFHHAVQVVTGNARPVQNESSFGIRKKFSDLRRDIRSGERRRRRAEFRNQPIDKKISIWF